MCVAAPTVDTTFRATATDDIVAPVEPQPTSRWAKSAVMLVFAVGSAAAAAAWHNHGDAARQMISNWVPAFAITSSPPAENAALPGQTDTPAAQVAVAEQPAAPPAASAQSPESAVTAAAAPSPDPTQLQAMARDLAAMAQQVEQLKASIAELKAGQHATRDVARTSEAKPAEIQTCRSKSTAKDCSRAAAANGRGASAPAAAGLSTRASLSVGAGRRTRAVVATGVSTGVNAISAASTGRDPDGGW